MTTIHILFYKLLFLFQTIFTIPTRDWGQSCCFIDKILVSDPAMIRLGMELFLLKSNEGVLRW